MKKRIYQLVEIMNDGRQGLRGLFDSRPLAICIVEKFFRSRRWIYTKWSSLGDEVSWEFPKSKFILERVELNTIKDFREMDDTGSFAIPMDDEDEQKSA